MIIEKGLDTLKGNELGDLVAIRVS